MKSFTKADEIAWLDKAIAELGPDTYLGATLADQRDTIASDIKSDMMPIQFAELRKHELSVREGIKELNREHEEIRAAIVHASGHLKQILNEISVANARRENSVRHLRNEAETAINALRILTR